jgi:hypothetical protein
MRAAVAVATLALTACSPASPQIEPIRSAIVSGLNWHYRWIEPIPRDVSSLECSVAGFERKSFAYCKPVLLSMDIETTVDRFPRVVNMIHEPGDFETSLADFRAHRDHGQALGPVQRVSIPLQDLGACKVDWKQTKQAVASALSQRQRGPFEKQGLQLRYPVMCERDPFYLIFFLRSDKIEWIWQFEVSPGGFDLVWSFDAGTQQRKIPELAAENLNKNDLWYQPPK